MARLKLREPLPSPNGSGGIPQTVEVPPLRLSGVVVRKADLIATLDGFSRDDVDAFAVESQRRAAKAWEAGHFKIGPLDN